MIRSRALAEPRQPDGYPLAAADSRAIWRVLVEECGRSASAVMAEQFVLAQARGCIEFRFQGALGFGGKFWNYDGRWFVKCYPEDETPERLRMIAAANARLAELKAREGGDG
jgi:hypothetical protein